MAVRRKNSVPGRTDASFHRDSPGDRPRSAAARVGQRHHGAKVRLDLVRERARADWEHTNRVPHAFHEPQRSASGDPSVILVMEPAEDRPGNNVLGRNTSRGQAHALAMPLSRGPVLVSSTSRPIKDAGSLRAPEESQASSDPYGVFAADRQFHDAMIARIVF